MKEDAFSFSLALLSNWASNKDDKDSFPWPIKDFKQKTCKERLKIKRGEKYTVSWSNCAGHFWE